MAAVRTAIARSNATKQSRAGIAQGPRLLRRARSDSIMMDPGKKPSLALLAAVPVYGIRFHPSLAFLPSLVDAVVGLIAD